MTLSFVSLVQFLGSNFCTWLCDVCFAMRQWLEKKMKRNLRMSLRLRILNCPTAISLCDVDP